MGRKIVLDSNVLVALYKLDDSTYQKAKELTVKLHNQGDTFLVLNLVIQEVATVISMKVGQTEAKEFFEKRGRVIDQEIDLDKDLEKLAWEIFLQQKRKGTSFVDCANIAVIEKYRLDGILTFDEFYPKEMRVYK